MAKFNRGDIAVRLSERKVVLIYSMSADGTNVFLEDGSYVPVDDIVAVADSTWLQDKRNEVNMLRRELAAVTNSTVTLDGKAFICSEALAKDMEVFFRHNDRMKAHIHNYQHRLKNSEDDTLKAMALHGTVMEKLGAMRGQLIVALDRVRNGTQTEAEAALEKAVTL